MASRKLESVPVSGEQAYCINLQVTASKGTGSTFPPFLLPTAPCSLTGQVTGSHLFLRLLVPLTGSKGSLRRLREGPVAPTHGCPGEGRGTCGLLVTLQVHGDTLNTRGRLGLPVVPSPTF